MSFSVAVNINDNARDVPERLRRLITGNDLKVVMGRAVRNALVAHFVELGNQRHRRDKRGPNFYGEVRRGVQQPDINNDGATVSINNIGIAQRLFGGTIRPGPDHQWLPISNSDIPGLAGRRPREFEDLKFVKFTPQLAALVSVGPLETRVSKKGNTRQVHVGPRVVLFWLKKEVVQQPDPTVLPDEKVLLDAAMAAGIKRVDRLNARSVAADIESPSDT